CRTKEVWHTSGTASSHPTRGACSTAPPRCRLSGSSRESCCWPRSAGTIDARADLFSPARLLTGLDSIIAYCYVVVRDGQHPRSDSTSLSGNQAWLLNLVGIVCF